jgi:patatin-like phospholipase/acyl hydrolase
MHNVLSLEGHGTQIIITNEILKLLEQKSGKQLLYSFDHVGAASTASFLGALIASGKSAEESSLIVKESFKKVFEVPDYFCAKWKDEWNYNPIKWVAWGKCMFWDADKSYSQKALDELLSNMPNDQEISGLKMHLTLTAAVATSKITQHHYLSKSEPGINLKYAVRNSIFDKQYFDSPEDSKSTISTSNGVVKLPVVAQL